MMRYQIGETLLLLENMSFRGAGKAQPIASAVVMDYSQATLLYKIHYETYSGQKGEIEVPEERLFSQSLATEGRMFNL